MRARSILAAVGCVRAAVGVVSATAAALDRVSLGAISGGDVRVPTGANCTLDRTGVDGNVLVGTNATLVANV